MPLVTGTVRTRYKKPTKDAQKDAPLHIELKLPLIQNTLDGLTDPQLFPKPLEDQGGTVLLGGGMNLILAG